MRTEWRLTPNANTYLNIISACSVRGQAEKAATWFERMRVAGISPALPAYNAVVTAHARARDLSGAGAWLERLREADLRPDAASYTSIISGCALRGDGAVKWLRRMRSEGVEPNGTSDDHVQRRAARLRLRRPAGRGPALAGERGGGRRRRRPRLDLAHPGPEQHGDDPPSRGEAAGAFRQMLAAGVRPDGPALRALSRAVGADECRRLCAELGVEQVRAEAVQDARSGHGNGHGPAAVERQAEPARLQGRSYTGHGREESLQRRAAAAVTTSEAAAARLFGGPASRRGERVAEALARVGAPRPAGAAAAAPLPLELSEEVAAALRTGTPVVALESTIISHGMPYPQNVQTAVEVEGILRAQGVTPATIGILEGRIHVGMERAQLDRLGQLGLECKKEGPGGRPGAISARRVRRASLS
ncbi:unnamed protein product [Prorocentrum cordatum]|uniref:Pseudouridine-5'-phosphate glycosidase n=1 Tax=Prorocentrum cordatum TaxID=2364126 RepID=A0ABN9WU97_9DINO|nr:unnamed protein product [Polarella glacialis]